MEREDFLKYLFYKIKYHGCKSDNMVANWNTDVFPLCITQLSLIVVLYHRYHSRTVDQKKPAIALSHSEDISF